jgi:hypothetical protein
MKADKLTPNSKLPRRGWLGAVAAATVGLALGTRSRPAGVSAPGAAALQPTAFPKAPAAPIAIRPPVDSVKRHG